MHTTLCYPVVVNQARLDHVPAKQLVEAGFCDLL
uniref:Uncharacterized protein n=1 Tax=Arundo donax TaxID=35708 RepID=A0A0A9F665_ARUDO